ncbi:hypothetical protein [Blastococcus brunescens]|uniref:Uncharacterized protein n=1 Tax=Blastococcus brunescens TaxID=1564165 RepID=A0ABZ1AZK6_9ACTN|nr:hypothetical protein [Blastococcus sp. BMG 8361]WRL64002.1 hypothetical protein U6N30_31160 [Blastococcus sp. BMG 8361]
MTGPKDRVAAFAARHEVLHTESIGGHSRSVVQLSGGADADDVAAAGLSTEPTSLQQLVVAMSLQPTRPGTAAPSVDLEEVPR